jgi:DNA-binding MarR family transcriptional regulator
LKTKSKSKRRPEHPIENYSFPLHPALIPNFGYCYTKTAMKFRKMFADELAAAGVQLPQQGLMIVLSKAGPMNQISLGEEMGIDKATMVKIIDQMEDSGFVRRNSDPSDRRVKLVDLTPKGRALLPKLVAIREKVEGRFLAPLSKAETAELRRLIMKLVHASSV